RARALERHLPVGAPAPSPEAASPGPAVWSRPRERRLRARSGLRTPGRLPRGAVLHTALEREPGPAERGVVRPLPARFARAPESFTHSTPTEEPHGDRA